MLTECSLHGDVVGRMPTNWHPMPIGTLHHRTFKSLRGEVALEQA